MKSIVFGIMTAALISMPVSAKINKIKAKNVTCSYLQEKLNLEKALLLKTKTLGIFNTKDLVYSEEVAEEKCPEYSTYDEEQYRQAAVVKTKDVDDCMIGYYCIYNYDTDDDLFDNDLSDIQDSLDLVNK